MKVGVLALQGDFREHVEILEKLGARTTLVRLPEDLTEIDRLIIPGGESTVIGKLLATSGLFRPIQQRIRGGLPAWGTCAGGIIMAKHIADPEKGQRHLKVMDITARRNAFGRQLDSFEMKIQMSNVSKKPIEVLFIRAPIFEFPGKDVEVLARLPDGRIVAARQNNMLITSFHPELTGATALHEYFLSL